MLILQLGEKEGKKNRYKKARYKTYIMLQNINHYPLDSKEWMIFVKKDEY